jgi:hypothetical protein
MKTGSPGPGGWALDVGDGRRAADLAQGRVVLLDTIPEEVTILSAITASRADAPTGGAAAHPVHPDDRNRRSRTEHREE